MENHKEWPTNDEQKKFPKYSFKGRQRLSFPLRRYQKESVTKFQVGELSVPKQRTRNNQTVNGRNENYNTIFVPEPRKGKYQ